MKTELDVLVNLLDKGNLGEAQKASVVDRLKALALLWKGSKLEEKTRGRKEMDMAAEFILLDHEELTRFCLENALAHLEAVTGIIAAELSYYEYLRLRLRNISASRFEKIAERAARLETLMKNGRYDEMHAAAERLLHLPYLNDPDLMGASGAIVSIVDYSFRLAAASKLYKAQGELFGPRGYTPDPREQKAIEKEVALLAETTKEGLLVGRFMTAYQSLLNDVRAGRVTHFMDDEAVFNKAFLDWSVDNGLSRGGPKEGTPLRTSRYWRARLYKTAFLSERSPCFNVSEAILLVLKIDDFGRLIPRSRQERRYETKNILVHYLRCGFKNAKQIPESQRMGFLSELCDAAVQDARRAGLLKDVTANDMENLYRAFELKPPAWLTHLL